MKISGAGVITEAISALFFVLQARTVVQLRQYHQSLVSLQDTLLAIRLTDGINGETPSATVGIIRDVVKQLTLRGSLDVTRPGEATAVSK